MKESQNWIAGPVRVVPETDASCILAAQTGRTFRIHVQAEAMTKWLELIDGTRSRAEGLEIAPAPAAEFAGVWDRLAAEGVLQPVADTTDRSWYRQLPQRVNTSRLRSYEFVMTGDPQLTAIFGRALDQAGLRCRIGGTEHTETAADLAGDVVLCPIYLNESWSAMVSVDDYLDSRGLTRVPIRVVDHKVYAGPAMRAAFGASLSDVLRRRKAAAQSLELFELEHGQPPPADPDRCRTSELAWAAAALAMQLERWLAGAARAELSSAELVFDLAQQTMQHHGVLAMPDRPGRRRPARATNEWHLRDDETGIVRSVKLHPTPPHLPANLHVAVARASNMRNVLRFPNDLTAFGSSWDDPEAALGPALGELIERYCANWRSPDAPAEWGSYQQLRKSGFDAIDPALLVGYSEHQHRQPGFPFARLTRETELTWLPATGLVTGSTRWVPACWSYVSWFELKPDREQRLLYPNLSGIAGGRSLEQATENALLETIERDASMVWWGTAPLSLRRVPVADFAPDLIGGWTDRFDCSVIEISRSFGPSTVAACVQDTETAFLTIGFATRACFAEAARKSLAEGFGLQWTGLTMRAAAAGSAQAEVLSSLRNLKPHRADNAYLDSYRSDFRDVKDLACQLQLYLDPRAGARVAPWTMDLPAGPAPQEAADRPTTQEIATRLRNRFGEEPVVVDLSTDDIREAGFSAVRVISPGLVPNFPAAFPQYGNGRVAAGAVDNGWRSEPLPEHELNTFPLAHF
jgi:ribosomal protein S12 methylthiotransferase accessory factor